MSERGFDIRNNEGDIDDEYLPVPVPVLVLGL
jgi:hypothetical protein